MSNMNKVAKELKKAMTESDERKPKAYDTEATVTHVDGNTLWVKFPGGETETPVRRTIDAKPGDVVMVRVANHRAWTGGNSTNPPTDDTRANHIYELAQPSIDFVAELRDKDVTVKSITAATGYIDDLYSKNIHTENIWAATGYIDELHSKNITTDNLEATTAYIKDLTAEEIEAGAITTKTLDAKYATINELHSDYAHIKDGVIDNAKIGYADVKDLHAHYAALDFANVVTADIQEAWIKNLMVQGQMVAQDGTIYRLTGLHLNANDIDVGQLKADRLLLLGDDGLYYSINVNTLGESYIEQCTEEEQLEFRRTIHADVITANSITVDKITTNNLIGTGGWINLRSGTFAYENASTGDGISWDGQHLSLRGDVEITSNNYYTKTDVDGLIGDIQDQVDGVVDTWYYAVDPTTSNAPASSWTTDNDRYNHLRDLYFNTTNGHSFRWAIERTNDASVVSGKRYYIQNSATGKYEYVTNPTTSGLAQYFEYQWIEIKDADAIKALSDAAKAQDTADGKRRVFTAQPTNAQEYDVGDLWVNATYGTTYNNDILKCKTKKAAGAAFNISHWGLASKYTDDSNVYKKSDFSITPEAIIGKVTAIEGWEIGGRNLVRNTATGKDIDKAGNCTIEYEDGELYYKWQQTTQNWDVIRFKPYFPIEFVKGKTITVSAEVRGFNLPSTARGNWFYINPTCLESQSVTKRNYYQNHTYSSDALTNNTWVKISYTVDVPTNFSSWSHELTTEPNYMSVFLYNYSGTRIDFRRIKLEVGNKATDWTPAPEDTDESISSLETEISEQAEAISLRATKAEVFANYGTCSTAAATAAKEVTLDGFALNKGAQISVRFDNGNTAASPTLNVNGTGAKAILIDGGTRPTADKFKLSGYSTANFTYDGTYWRYTGGSYESAQLVVQAGQISSKVEKNGVMSAIDQTPETIKIKASKIEFDGTAQFVKDVQDSIQVGGRNLFGHGSDLQESLEGLTNYQNGFSITTEGGFKCAHATGALETTKYLLSKLSYTPKPLETFTYSAYVKIKKIVKGTTNPMCELYFGGATIDGSWRGFVIEAIYVDGKKAGTTAISFDGYIKDTNWHHVVVVAHFNYSGTSTIPALYSAIYLRDCTGDLYIHHVKLERGNKATDWSPAPEDVQVEINAVDSKADGANLQEQRIYYRSKVSGTVPKPTAWITNTANKYNDTVSVGNSGWSTKVTPIASGTGSSVTKYLYLYTCIQRKTVGGDVTFTDVLLDDTTTVIDGGNIVTGTVTANKLDASDINASKTLTVGAMTTAAQESILNSNVQVGGENLLQQFLLYNNPTNYNPYTIPLTENLIAGETYTLQLWGVKFSNTPAGGTVVAYWGGGSSNLTGNLTPDSTGYVCKTFTVSQASADREPDGKRWYINLYNSVPNDSKTARNMTLARWKLEKGNKATDWSISSADTRGGNNLLRCTADMNVGSGGWPTGRFRASGGTVSHVNAANPHPDGIIGAIRVTNGGSEATRIGFAQDQVPNLVANKLYTLSGWLRASAGGLTVDFQPIWKSSSQTTGSLQVGMTAVFWNYFSATLRLTGDQADTYAAGYVYVNNVPANGWFEVCGLKLEEGAIATGWSAGQEANASNFITQIDNNGIRVHPSSTENNSVLINGNGMYIYQDNIQRAYFQANAAAIGTINEGRAIIKNDGLHIYTYDTAQHDVGFFGSTARIGKTDDAAFYINSNSLQAYYMNGTSRQKYFEVSASGLKYGANLANTVETTTGAQDKADAAKNSAINTAAADAKAKADKAALTADTYITDIDNNNGITLKNANHTNNYLEIKSGAINIYRNGDPRAQFQNDWLCLGDGGGARITMNTTDSNAYIFMAAQNNKSRFLADSSGVKVGHYDKASGETDSDVNYSYIKSDGLHVYQANTEVASFGATARIGAPAKTFIYIDPTGNDAGIKFRTNGNGLTGLTIADFGMNTNTGWTTAGTKNWPKEAWYTLGCRKGTKGYYSLIAGFDCTATHNASFALGIDCNCYAPTAFAMGSTNTVGDSTKTSANSYSGAVGSCSAAIGYGLTTQTSNQVVVGQCNATDANARFIVGNGTSTSARKNAFVVHQDGSIAVSGTYTGLYKITTASEELASGIAANSYISATNVTMTAQSGYNAVGIVGWSTSHWRIRPTTHYISNNTTIRAGFANDSATKVDSSVTITFYVLWLKATSA